MIDNMTVAKTIIALRSSRNMTQQQFAAILGVSHQAVSKWENGAALPDLEAMLEITRLFGITMEQLLSGNIPEFERETENEKETSDFLSSIMGKEAADALRKSFNDCRTACERIGEKLGKAVDDLVNDIDGEDDGTAESKETEAEETEEAETEQKQKLSLKAIIELAPFMSHEKIAELLTDCEEPLTPDTLCAIAPFLNSGDLEQFIKELPEGAFTMDCLIVVAPFLSRETLFRLAAANADKLDVDSLKCLAPFLRKNMVDGLTNAMQNFMHGDFMSSVQDFTAMAGKKLGQWGVQGFEYAKDVYTQVAKAAKETCDEFKKAEPAAEEKGTPAKEEPSAPARGEQPAPDDGLREKIIRAALEAGNWAYLRGRLSSVTSSGLLTAVCSKAIDDLPYEDALDIVMNALPYLDEDGMNGLARRMAENELWDMTVSAAPFAGAAAAEIVLEAAFKNRTEASIAAAKAIAKKASRETLAALTEKAIAEGAWDFISAIDGAI